ncbi:MAG: hypothetical protein ACLFU2_12150 [Opitutales bacterium]
MNEGPQLTLDEVRALLRRLELVPLEASDYVNFKGFLTGVIAEAEAAGLENISLELTDEDQGA